VASTSLSTFVCLGNTSASKVDLHPIGLDEQLTALTIDQSGSNGRFAIGHRTIEPTTRLISELLNDRKQFETLTPDETKNLLICVAAALKTKENGSFIENPNVKHADGAFTSFVGNEVGTVLKVEDILTAYSRFKANLARRTLPRTGDEYSKLSKVIQDDLAAQGKRMHFLTVIPQNKIPYVLLIRNPVTGLYEFPEQKEGTTQRFPKDIIEAIGDQVPTDLSFHIDSFNTRGAISVVNPAIDSALRAHYGIQASLEQSPNYLLVRLCNLGILSAKVFYPSSYSATSEYAGITPSSELYTVVGTQPYLLAPSVLMGQNMLSGLLGFMGRVADFSVESAAARWLTRPLPFRAPLVQTSSPATVSATTTPTPVTFTTVGLSDAQINLINETAINFLTGLDPRRPGAEFQPLERGIATVITQIAPCSEDGYMTALCVVFSPERARALLDAIIGIDED
jgi:hypothetical protein